MALAKLVCGDCGATISPADAFCPSCGARIDREAGVVADRVCKECGSRNAPRSEFCASCGAAFAEAVSSRGASPRPEKPPVRRGEERRNDKRSPVRHRFEPWQYIAAAAVLALAAYFIYGEISADRSRLSGSSPSAAIPQNAPLMGGGPSGSEIRSLRETVNAEPKNPAALLKLANALHDARDFAGAAETYGRYLALRPKDPDALTDMGICYFQIAQTDTVNAMSLMQQAVRAMQTAQSIVPSHQQSAYNLGVVYLHMGAVDESTKWFTRAVALNKNSDLGVRAQNILAQRGLQQ